MATQLSTSAVTASALFTNGIFRIPPFQREYSWGEDEIKDLCNDLKNGMKKESYFLGLVILIGKDENYTVVDGQQRLTTLSLLAIALCREAERASRESLARSIRNNFLYKIDYETDQEKPRLNFTDPEDNATYTSLLSGDVHEDVSKSNANSKLLVAYGQIQKYIRNTIRNNAWQQLGEWTKFLDNKVYFATFTHPDENAAYQVFEVINTRGRELTTADLLKNRLLSQIQSTHHQNEVYARWQDVAKSFRQDGSNTFVQYIRHVVTLTSGHVLPKDLYNFLVSDENNLRDRNRPNLDILLNDLEEHLENYLQMIEPARTEELQKRAIYLALNDLNVVAVRPILLAILNCHDCIQGMDRILKFVVRRVVVGSLGTGNVERILSEAARRIWQEKKMGTCGLRS
ncbi:DUF262 domain-containing protein [Kamptonema cortianum]|nr:DUF262 domain-containing protein [Kamptonema cortianum]